MPLSTLSPAEVLVLQHLHRAPVRHMLRLTFADLVLRDVLRLQCQPFQSSPYDPPVDHYYVRPGDNAAAHPLRPHEAPLLAPLPADRRMVLLRHYVTLLLEHLPPPRHFRQLVTESFELEHSFQRSNWLWFWQTLALTPRGQAQLAAVQRAMATQDWVESSWAPALARSPGTGLLLGGAPPPELLLFDHELLRALRKRRAQGYLGQDWSTGVGDGGTSSTDSSGASGSPDFGGGHSGGGGADGDFGSGDGDGGGGDSGCSSGCSGCGGGD
jgi:hypothetical protein